MALVYLLASCKSQPKKPETLPKPIIEKKKVDLTGKVTFKDGKYAVIVSDILFEYNSTKIVGNESSITEVIKLIDLFEANEIDYTLYVQGYADKTGNKRYNKIISKRRADFVVSNIARGKKKLKAKIISIGMGASTDFREYSKNRRVIFFLKYKSSPKDVNVIFP